MKKVNILLAALLTYVSVGAQTTMREAWLNMPDEIIPYLNKNLRTEHIDFLDMGVKSEVNNKLNGVCVMDTLTTDYTHVTLSNSSSVELRLLSVSDTTSIICMLKTYSAPASETSVTFYDAKWNPLNDNYGLLDLKNLEEKGLDSLVESFAQRPDTMSVERYQELCKLVDPVMVSATADIKEPVITYSLSVPLVVRDDKEPLERILRQRKFKWDGRMFKEI